MRTAHATPPNPLAFAEIIPQNGQAMSTITFDTLKFVERLEKAGVPREQASAMAEAFKDASGEAEIATRKDVALAVAEIKTEIANVRGEMVLVKWMLGAVLAIAIANFAKQFF